MLSFASQQPFVILKINLQHTNASTGSDKFKFISTLWHTILRFKLLHTISMRLLRYFCYKNIFNTHARHFHLLGIPVATAARAVFYSVE